MDYFVDLYDRYMAMWEELFPSGPDPSQNTQPVSDRWEDVIWQDYDWENANWVLIPTENKKEEKIKGEDGKNVEVEKEKNENVEVAEDVEEGKNENTKPVSNRWEDVRWKDYDWANANWVVLPKENKKEKKSECGDVENVEVEKEKNENVEAGKNDDVVVGENVEDVVEDLGERKNKNSKNFEMAEVEVAEDVEEGNVESFENVEAVNVENVQEGVEDLGEGKNEVAEVVEVVKVDVAEIGEVVEKVEVTETGKIESFDIEDVNLQSIEANEVKIETAENIEDVKFAKNIETFDKEKYPENTEEKAEALETVKKVENIEKSEILEPVEKAEVPEENVQLLEMIEKAEPAEFVEMLKETEKAELVEQIDTTKVEELVQILENSAKNGSLVEPENPKTVKKSKKVKKVKAVFGSKRRRRKRREKEPIDYLRIGDKSRSELYKKGKESMPQAPEQKPKKKGLFGKFGKFLGKTSKKVINSVKKTFSKNKYESETKKWFYNFNESKFSKEGEAALKRIFFTKLVEKILDILRNCKFEEPGLFRQNDESFTVYVYLEKAYKRCNKFLEEAKTKVLKTNTFSLNKFLMEEENFKLFAQEFVHGYFLLTKNLFSDEMIKEISPHVLTSLIDQIFKREIGLFLEEDVLQCLFDYQKNEKLQKMMSWDELVKRTASSLHPSVRCR